MHCDHFGIRGIPVKKAPLYKKAPPFRGRLEQRGGFLIQDSGDRPAAGENFEVFHQFSVRKSCKNSVFGSLERRRRQKFSPAALKTTKNLLKSIIFGQNLEAKILYKKAPPPFRGRLEQRGGAFLTGIPLIAY